MTTSHTPHRDLRAQAVEIAAAYVAKNPLPMSDLPALIDNQNHLSQI